MTADVLPLLAEAVDELTKPHTHREQISRYENGGWIHERHHTHVPPLLQQLRAAVEPSSSAQSGKSTFSSRPSARIDAIDTLRHIERQVDDWLVRRCGAERRHTLEDDLRALIGLASTLTDEEQWDLTRDARRWAYSARITTGWEVRAFEPANTCPICSERGGLRVRVGDGVTSSEATALCTRCRAVWEPENIGLLAEHIRYENGESDTRGDAA